MEKVKYVVMATYILRVLGAILVIAYFLGGTVLYNLFPALEGASLNPVFYAGIAFYAFGAIIYYLARNRKQPSSRDHEDE
ncbi:MAG: hypothetical protein LBR60_06425 [Fibrobacter sp.]|jgi:predicted membrane channel-forming protein YqfA (hemolysin III family)|nr:hypothetical protein [Fibrobacter sp.]